MKRSLLIIAALIFSAPWSLAVDIHDTRLLQQPAVSADHVAFVYANDVWIAGRDGSGVRRLTISAGVDVAPCFSPDGQTLAFSGQYHGQWDVYVVSVEGGTPKRLTWHPGSDMVRGWTPDGDSVLFESDRSSFTRRYGQFYTVSREGGMPVSLGIPSGHMASYSPDGQYLAYTPNREAFREWKNYRGGTHSRIWILNLADFSVEPIPQPQGRCNDTNPIWLKQGLFFLSDRDGEFNLYQFTPGAPTVNALTRFEDFPILHASGWEDTICFEQAGYLHLFMLKDLTIERLKIGVAADLLALRERFVNASEYVRSAAISPTGVRGVFDCRGEIITVPADKGDARNITLTSGAHETSPAWSPDGEHIAYYSDASGENELVLSTQDGKGDRRSYPLDGSGFYGDLTWSPDSQWLSYTDNSQSLYVLNVESGQARKVAQEVEYSPLRTMTHAWSPDSQWMAYTLNLEGLIQTVFVYSVETAQSHQVTDGLSEASCPVFDASGKYLYFFASTDAGPVKDWFSMANADMELTQSVYLAVLKSDLPSPLAPQSDEEPVASKESGEDDGAKPSKKKKDAEEKSAADEKEEGVKVTIDFDGLQQRIVALPIPTGIFDGMEAGPEGVIYFLSQQPAISGQRPQSKIVKFSLEDQKLDTLVEQADGFDLSMDHKKILIAHAGSFRIADVSAASNGKGQLNLDAMRLKIDPVKEWQQIFDEAWRINRDFFYATNYHGVDWNAMKAKYAPFVPHAAVRSDLNRIIQWMCSELAVGHHRVGGGDQMIDTETIPVGLLGADYDVAQGRHRFKTIYGGLNWNPDLRAPLTEPGVDVHEGDLLLAVDGENVRGDDNLFAFFEGKVDRMVKLTVAGPDGENQRTVTVKPIDHERSLRNRAWVESNLAYVNEKTDGRVAYVYVPNTTGAGHEYFKRYFYPQCYKDGIIVDERFNGGGQVADYAIDLLRRPKICHWATRYGRPLVSPKAAIFGPKVMLIDENAGSGGDLLPWMFRKLDLGLLIGKTTWGGLVGVLGFPPLVDGGFVTAPDIAIFNEEGWVVENTGVSPDIEVEQWPAEMRKGGDPQLDRAIEEIMKALKAEPVEHPQVPPFPVRNPG